MTFKNSQQSRVLVGQVAYSAYARSVTTEQTSEMLDTSVLESTAKAFIPGQVALSMSMDVILDTDTATDGLWDRSKNWKASAALPVSYFSSGYAAGSEVLLVNSLLTGFASKTGVGSTVDGSITVQGTDEFAAGVSLEPPTALTITNSGTARDGTAATANGGIAHLHVTAFSGLTSDVVTIEHSVDGSTAWATLVTFATVTATTSERVAVAAGVTVRRYLRVVDTVIGTGSVTRQVSFARR